MAFLESTTQYSRFHLVGITIFGTGCSEVRSALSKIIFWATGIPPGCYQSFNCRDRDQHANSDRRARAGVCHLRSARAGW